MASWRFLQLEPSALRQSDGFEAPAHLGSNGAHLPATLDRLARLGAKFDKVDGTSHADPVRIYGQVANRLSELIDNVREIWVDRDERRQLLTLYLNGHDGTNHPARALSDGTLRFLALAVIEIDPQEFGLLCLEEPENGIHPARIPAMIRLLQDIATDPTSPVGPDNPLRQVIVNTHSPVVVQQVPDDSLLIAHLQEQVDGTSEMPYQSVQFGHVPDTWRSKERGGQAGAKEIAKGNLLAYLNPVQYGPASATKGRRTSAKRLIDRPDLQLMMPGIGKG
jgi:predicted ATPase